MFVGGARRLVIVDVVMPERAAKEMDPRAVKPPPPIFAQHNVIHVGFILIK